MKSLKLSFLVLVCLFVVAGQNQVKYFLSELDFLSNRNVPKSEVVRKKHIRAEYDSMDRLVRKTFIDRLGRSIGSESYSYLDTNTVARQKDLIDKDGKLFFKTIFGRESESVSYIEWVFGVDSVKKWDDRFTTSSLNDQNMPKDYRFFDVDAFEYGGKVFDYDSLGRLIRDEWFRRPDGKSMHKFIYRYYDDLDITHVFEYDSNGVLIMDVKLSPDGTEAVFWFTGPKDTSFVNSSTVFYNLDGDLKWGDIGWTIPGSVDTVGSSLLELLRGDHTFSLPDESVLFDSMRYDVLFEGEGVKGYMATKRKILNLIYDISPPIMSLEMDKYMKDVTFSYETSEILDSSFVVWVPDSNFKDISSDTVRLTEKELFLRERFTPVNQGQLVDGVMYNPEIYGFDRAGNMSIPGTFKGVIYDITPPVLSFVSPNSGDWINNQKMEMKTNEPLQRWSIRVKSQGGVPDVNSPHSHIFQDTVQVANAQDLINYFQLQDGSMYLFEMIGSDLAGNVSETVRLDSIRYDVTPPVITMIYPFNNEAINNPSVSYAISERLAVGEILWTQIEGSVDSLSPHIVEMVDSELDPEEKIRINMTNEPILNDGSVYSITLTGRDLAGNDSEAISVTNILYDTTPPQFTNVGPDSGMALNHQRISFTVSENLHKGAVMWIQTNGVEDPDAPHIVNLEGNELSAGKHTDFILFNMPKLQDGGVYTIQFTGSDRAGNVADTISIQNILYDFTTPVIAVNYPTSQLITNSTDITYSLSENLYEAAFEWTRYGGVEDSLAPYRVKLTRDEMKQGMFSRVQLTSLPEFVENTVYTLTFNGRDRAGNIASEVVIAEIEYDFTPPQLSWLSPKSGSAVNHKDVSFEKSELLQSGSITWRWTSGVSDPDSLHIMQLFNKELEFGVFEPATIVNAPSLVDGGIYTITFSALDPAGNESNITIVDEILYDITQPVILLTYPLPRSISKTSAVTYNLSETLFEGEFKWIWLGGVADPSAPYTAVLTENERQVGDHIDVELTNNPTVVENALYTMSLSGRDRAGNKAKRAFVPGLQYDFTPPELSIISPDTGSAINIKKVHFANSELLQSAEMIWIQTGGIQDLNSPHVSVLENDELLGKEIGPVDLYNIPNLNDGSEYSLLFVGMDPAGNISDTVTVSSILYDITSPVIEITYPTSDIYTAESRLIFEVNENIYDFSIDWVGENSSDKIAFLLEEKLEIGSHNSDDLFKAEIQDATTYTVTINGRDRAGNQSQEAKLSNIRVDLTPPEFSTLKPASGSFVNTADVGWFLSEDIDSGMVYFSRKGSNSKLEAPLIGKELAQGTKQLGPLNNYVALRDGELYTISIVGQDFASNVSEEVSVIDITFDTSPPEIAIEKPQSESFVNSNQITFSVNEPFTSAKMIWQGKGLEPQEFVLRDSHLSQGKHILKDYGVRPLEKVFYNIHIEGLDRATNLGVSDTLLNVTFDITPPVLTISSPISDSPVNSSQLTLNFSEPLKKGRVTWVATAGPDPNSPHVRNFSEQDRQQGDKIDFIFESPPSLVDGVEYQVVVEGTDLAGNKGEPFKVNNVFYDITPPRFTDVEPLDSTFINEAYINYTLSENLMEGKIYFENVGGSSDPKTTHMITLAGNKKNKGNQGGKLPPSFIRLVNGSIYNIRFEGVDAAGNSAPEVVIKNIVFDNEIPVLAVSKPTNNSFINSPQISFSISEDLVKSSLELEHIAGTTDPSSPHVILLSEEKRKMGSFDDEVFLKLGWVDGATYSMTFKGIDFAGNEAKQIIVENITFDVTNPIVSIDKIQNNNYININTLSYTLSEPLSTALFIITQTNGVEDLNSPQELSLSANELSKGSFLDVLLNNTPQLNNGSIYKFELKGQDYANNPSNIATIEGITYDNEPPEISISRPIDAEQIKSTVISYTLSEDLLEATAVFTQTSGTVDPNSPHRVPLSVKELKKGVHSDFDLGITSQLADGGRYRVTIEGKDRAGNNAVVSEINDVFFDLLPPVISIDSPASGSRINLPIVTYATNEELGEGNITFTRTGGTQDPDSPHVVNLSGQRLKQGTRYDETFESDLQLKDGSVYSISFGAQDMAGNIATDVSIQNITFDSSAPQLSITSPLSPTFTNDLMVEYSTNENLSKGVIFVERTGGPNDSSSPHEVELVDGQLIKSSKISLNLSQQLNLVSNAVYRIYIEGLDVAGNEGKSDMVESITFDNVPPEISITSPAVESFINAPVLGLKANETLSKATIDWLWESGEADQIGKHSSVLVGGSLIEGDYPQVNFDPAPKLKSGAWYVVTYNGTDRAGNSATFTLGRLFYDNIPPKISGLYPPSNTFTNIAEVSYSSNESLSNGVFSWIPKDGSTPLEIALIGRELNEGTYGIGILTDQTDLKDGLAYDLQIKAQDQALNETVATVATNVRFDITKPTFSEVFPVASSRINTQTLRWTVDEKLKSGKYTWIHMGGDPDPNAPHELALPEDLLGAGQNNNTKLQPLNLILNAMYRITLEGTDLAGNTGKKFIMSVVYDNVPPVLKLSYPESNTAVNHLDIAYALDEQLENAQIIYTRVGGDPDPNSPVAVELQGSELESSFETQNTTSTLPVLNDGSVYNIQFKGVDLATNSSESNIIENIKYDVTRPKITIFYPSGNSFFMGSDINIDISEDLKEGAMIWSRTGGLNDNVTKHDIPLYDQYLKKGSYTKASLPIEESLSAGVVYSLGVDARDFADNEAEPVLVESIEFIRDMGGKWYYKGAIIEVVWIFEPNEDGVTGKFMQGLSLGTKISDEERGTYTFDFNQNPYLLTVVMDDASKNRISLVEFMNNNRIRVVTGTKKPGNMSDGEVMEYEWRPE